MIDIFLVDDHELVRTGMARMLDDEEGVRVVGQAASGEEALALVPRLKPDLVLMDLRMPGMGGLEATRRLMRLDDGPRVMVVTVCEGGPFPTRLLQAGALGYVGKSADLAELMGAIKTVCCGQRYVSPYIAQTIALGPFSLNDLGPLDMLSQRELQIMILLVNGRTVRDVADELSLSPKTINTYRYRIFDKLGVKGDVRMTLLAMHYGLIDLNELYFI